MLEPAIEELISRALAEDVGLRDMTAEAVVDAGTRARGRIEQKQPGVLFGLEVAHAVFRRLDPLVSWRPVAEEGEWRKETPAVVVEIEGDARALLTGERVALNFLGHLSGVATTTATCVYALRGTGVTVLDTRKTLPGLRLLEKQAVAAGGGTNHRMGLHDAVLVKENHAALAGGVGEATRRALARRPAGMAVTVECRTLAEVEEAVAAGAERLLLDNMSLSELGSAVEAANGRVALEASGGYGPMSLGEIARDPRASRLQFISIGALTHSAPALDLSMKLEAP
jgi:nicotinate-nucleotide pyrophosphorylase (carboxylating)